MKYSSITAFALLCGRSGSDDSVSDNLFENNQRFGM